MSKKRLTPEQLQDFMNFHGLSRYELADILGVTDVAVFYWVNGERTITPIVSKIIRLLDRYPQLLREI